MSAAEGSGPNPPWAFDTDSESITVEWDKEIDATCYQLDWRVFVKKGWKANDWTTASNKLGSCVVRKKNLTHEARYEFRVRLQLEGEWTAFSEPCEPISLIPPGQLRLAAPTLQASDRESLTVEWKPLPIVPDTDAYELQWKPAEAGESQWLTASNKLKGTVTRKKNLSCEAGYVFRVRPKVGGEWGHFSHPSASFQPREQAAKPSSGASSFLGKRVK